ncbi:isochorismatase family protein [Spirosoma sp. BT702]|uniref:Isochorismatase family protein n=1 Tax=Spirosoma profusum TaxID=2771354 RepID=A0A927APF5_9BACT|nr:cysteine hydrolase [Spirosoma profusum]MBD2704354.1 isochorismatase family protein [Spirosoma profusum]
MKSFYLLLFVSLSVSAIAQSQISNSKKIALPAKPVTIDVDVDKTAVIVVDMQNDFGSKGGMFDRAGIKIATIQKAVAPTARVLEAARQADIPIIYLKMGYQPDLSDVGSEDSPNRIGHLQFLHVGQPDTAPDGSKGRILIRGSWGTEIVSELKPRPDDIVLYKTRFSGFYQTDLDAILKKLGKKYLIVTGCTTSICVESTIRDAMFRDYSSVLLSDCTAEPMGANLSRSNYEASLLAIEAFGWVSSSDEFIKGSKAVNSTVARKQK